MALLSVNTVETRTQGLAFQGRGDRISFGFSHLSRQVPIAWTSPGSSPSLGFEGLSHLWLETLKSVCLTSWRPGRVLVPSCSLNSAPCLSWWWLKGEFPHQGCPDSDSSSLSVQGIFSNCTLIVECDQVELQACLRLKSRYIGVHLEAATPGDRNRHGTSKSFNSGARFHKFISFLSHSSME